MGNQVTKLRTRRKEQKLAKQAKKHANAPLPDAEATLHDMTSLKIAEVLIDKSEKGRVSPSESTQNSVQCPVEFSRTQSYRYGDQDPGMDKLRFRPGSPRFRRAPYNKSISSEYGVSSYGSQARISPEIKLTEAISTELMSSRASLTSPLDIPEVKMDLLQVPHGGAQPCLLPSFSLPEKGSPRTGRFSSHSLSLSIDCPTQATPTRRRSSVGRPPLKRHEAVDTPDSPPFEDSIDNTTWTTSTDSNKGSGQSGAISPVRHCNQSSIDVPVRLNSCHSTESAPPSSVVKRRPSPLLKREKFKEQRRQPTSRSFDSSAGQMLVRHVWNRMMASKGPVTIGQDIFQRMYFTRPEVRTTLKIVCSNRKITNFGGFQKAHAKAVADILDSCIRSDLDPENILKMLAKCGALHAEKEFTEFKHDYWETFGEAILWCSLEWGNRNQRTEESRKVWMDIINFLVDNLKLFYSQQKPRVRLSISPSGTTSTES